MTSKTRIMKVCLSQAHEIDFLGAFSEIHILWIFFRATIFPGLPTDPILHAWVGNTQTLDDDDDDEFDDELDDCSMFTQLFKNYTKS